MEVGTLICAVGSTTLLHADFRDRIPCGVHRLHRREHNQSALLVAGAGGHHVSSYLRLHFIAGQQSQGDADHEQPLGKCMAVHSSGCNAVFKSAVLLDYALLSGT